MKEWSAKHKSYTTSLKFFKKDKWETQLDVSVYNVNTQEGSPSHFSNKSYTLIVIFADNQFVHVIIK